MQSELLLRNCTMPSLNRSQLTFARPPVRTQKTAPRERPIGGGEGRRYQGQQKTYPRGRHGGLGRATYSVGGDTIAFPRCNDSSRFVSAERLRYLRTRAEIVFSSGFGIFPLRRNLVQFNVGTKKDFPGEILSQRKFERAKIFGQILLRNRSNFSPPFLSQDSYQGSVFSLLAEHTDLPCLC